MKNRKIATIICFGLLGLISLTLVGQDKSTDKAPDTFQAKFETTAGDFVIEVHREWSPNGADQFYRLLKAGFYDDCKFFRVIPGFMVQFGINGDPKIQGEWRERNIKDDPKGSQSNQRGFVTFAKSSAPNSRSTQVFINYVDNSRLDSSGFTPFGKVIEGMENVDKIYSRHGEDPRQDLIQFKGNSYLKSQFPKLDGIKKATIIENK